MTSTSPPATAGSPATPVVLEAGWKHLDRDAPFEPIATGEECVGHRGGEIEKPAPRFSVVSRAR